MIRLTGLIGIIGIVGLAYAFSTDRRAIRLRTILWGLGLQIVFAIMVLRWTFGQRIMSALRAVTGEARVRTPDLGGKNTTKEFTGAVVEKIKDSVASGAPDGQSLSR